jgi:hypothetical protein
MVGVRTQVRVRRRLGLPMKAPQGWRTGAPDFVGVGAQRSGTSWWFRQVTGHPDVVAPWGKERHYFCRFWQREFADADAEGYGRLFPRPDGALTGEWTPRYMHDPWTPGLLRRAAPDARILIILRDPWERLLGGLGHEFGVLGRELQGGNGDYLRMMIRGDAFQRSCYAGQVERVLSAFDRDQVMILQYERCIADPRAELERTFEFLGLDVPRQLEIEVKATISRRPPPMPEAVAEGMRAALADDVERLTRTVPEIDLDLWPSCR